MSDEREVTNIAAPKGTVIKSAADLAKDKIAERAQKKARMVQVLERGVVHDRLIVNLPAHLYGEWVRKDSLSVEEMRTIGFEIDTEYAPKRALHSDGSGSATIADVVFMTTTRENKELIDEIRADQFAKVHAKPVRPGQGITSKSIEEQQYEAGVASATGGEIPTMVESRTHIARKAEIEAALARNATKNNT